MVGVTEARRGMLLLAHHAKPLEDQFLAEAFAELRSPLWPPSEILGRVRGSRERWQLRPAFHFTYPHPNATYDGEEAVFSVTVRQSDSFQLSNGRKVSLSPLVRERDNWLKVDTNYKRLNYLSQLDVDWYLEKVRGFLPKFEPDFVFGDTDVAVAKYCGDNPAETVWPLAYYGQAHVVQIGRERLLNAPAWEVQEDKRGGIWIQAAANPFRFDPANVKALGEHLGLKGRK